MRGRLQPRRGSQPARHGSMTKTSKRKPVVALIGRTNVGKSTLFNLLAKKRVAVVHDMPHVTRDRVFADVTDAERPFLLVDTGGMEPQPGDDLRASVARQAEFAVEEADVLVLVTDGIDGLTATDHWIADRLRKAGKPALLAVNKMESSKRGAEDFFALRLGEPLAISALSRLNVGTLVKRVSALLPAWEPPVPEEGLIRMAVVGHPNVGKSSLVNAILGEERMLVSEQPGTTRDAVDTEFVADDQHFLIVDTAGIRKKGKVKAALEYYSTLRSFRAVDEADVAAVVLDATEGITRQDQRIAGYAHQGGKGAVFVVNKWDLVEQAPIGPRAKETSAMRDFRRVLYRRLVFMRYAPVLFCSAKKGWGVQYLPPAVSGVHHQAEQRVGTSEVNRVLALALAEQPPPAKGTRTPKVYYGSQVSILPPTFALFVNDPELIHFSYQRHLENVFRRAFGLTECPVRLVFRRAHKRRREAAEPELAASERGK